MRVSKSILGGLLVACLSAAPALAQSPTYVVPTSYYAGMMQEASPSDLATDGCTTCGPCEISCDPCSPCYDPCVEYKLFPNGICGLDVDMWLDTGVYGNTYGEADTPTWYNTGLNDGWVVNQLWLSVGKEAETGCGAFDIGGHMDFLFGTDARLFQGFRAPGTWDTTWGKTGADYAWAMPQLYGEVATGNFRTKIGHFGTLLGYELMQAPDNFFYSYGQVWGTEPITHTGVLTSYEGFENLTISGGWVAGWDTGFANPDDASMFLGSVGADVTDWLTLTYTVVGGSWGTGEDTYFHTILADVALTENLNYVFQNDLGTDYGGDETQPGWRSGGIANYLFYTINDCWAVGTRLEWAYAGQPGAEDDVWALTTGLNWTPCENIKVRPELRYDWAQGATAPYNGGLAKDQWGGGVDLIVTW